MNPSQGKRRKRRIHLKDTSLKIEGTSYKIVNINEYGVGFLINSPEDIEIGSPLGPMVFEGSESVQVNGIPRHISQLTNPDSKLYFKTGWVCGTEFSTAHDIECGKLLSCFISEHIREDVDEV